MSLSRFRADILDRGVARSHSFLANITIPTYLRSKYSSLGELLQIRCDTAQLPGMNLATLEGIPKYGYGVPATVPYAVLYDSLNLTFIADRNGQIHQFFYDWLGVIVNFDNSQGMTNKKNGFNTYEVGYKEKFSTTVEVTQYDGDDKMITTKMTEAFPKGINSVDLGWDQTDNIIRVSVPFTFKEYTTQYHNGKN